MGRVSTLLSRYYLAYKLVQQYLVGGPYRKGDEAAVQEAVARIVGEEDVLLANAGDGVERGTVARHNLTRTGLHIRVKACWKTRCFGLPLERYANLAVVAIEKRPRVGLGELARIVGEIDLPLAKETSHDIEKGKAGL